MQKIISVWVVGVFIFVMLGLYYSIGLVTQNHTILIFLKVYFIYIIFFSVILYVSILFNSPDDNTTFNFVNNATAALMVAPTLSHNDDKQDTHNKIPVIPATSTIVPATSTSVPAITNK